MAHTSSAWHKERRTQRATSDARTSRSSPTKTPLIVPLPRRANRSHFRLLLLTCRSSLAGRYLLRVGRFQLQRAASCEPRAVRRSSPAHSNSCSRSPDSDSESLNLCVCVPSRAAHLPTERASRRWQLAARPAPQLATGAAQTLANQRAPNAPPPPTQPIYHTLVARVLQSLVFLQRHSTPLQSTLFQAATQMSDRYRLVGAANSSADFLHAQRYAKRFALHSVRSHLARAAERRKCSRALTLIAFTC